MPDIGLDPTTRDLPDVPTLIDGPALVQQRIRTRLLRGRAEWFVNLQTGLPLLEWRQQKPPDEVAIRATLQAEIVQIDGVVATENFTSSFDSVTKTLRVSGDVRIDGGSVVTISVSAEPPSLGRNRAYWLISFTGARDGV